MVQREHMLSMSRRSLFSVLHGPAMFFKTVVQGSICLVNVGVGALGTWNAVHHSLPVVCLYWVLGVYKVLSQGPEGTEGDLNG